MSAEAPFKPARSSILKRLFLAFFILISGLVLFSITVFYALPMNILEDKAKEALKERAGLLVSEESFERVFPFGFEARGVEFSDASGGRPLFKLDKARASLDIPGLLTGRLNIKLTAGISGAAVEGGLAVKSGGTDLILEWHGLELKHIPALERAGLQIGGGFSGKLALFMPKGACPSGSLRLKGGGFKDDGIRFRGFPLPAGDISDAGIKAEIKDCKALVEGLWVEGAGLSLRLQGWITLATPVEASPLDMTIEVMPKGDIKDREFPFSFLSAFRKSANYYLIPVRGTLANPSTG